MRARTLGGSKNPIKPYALRVDVPTYQAEAIIKQAEVPGAPYWMTELAKAFSTALAPYKR
jgi:hypothetical protein